MIPILTLLLGFLTNVIPSVVRFFETKQKYKFELQMATLKLEASIRNIEATQIIYGMQKTVEDVESARNMEIENPHGLMENFRASVRPVITYLFVGLLIFFKLLSLKTLVDSGLTLENMEVASKIIFDEITLSIITSVVGFYFGSRLMGNR